MRRATFINRIACLALWMSLLVIKPSHGQDLPDVQVSLPDVAGARVLKYTQSHVMLGDTNLVELHAYNDGRVIVELNRPRKDIGRYELVLSRDELKSLLEQIVAVKFTSVQSPLNKSDTIRVDSDPTVSYFSATVSLFTLSNGLSVPTPVTIDFAMGQNNAQPSDVLQGDFDAEKSRALESRMMELVERAKDGPE